MAWDTERTKQLLLDAGVAEFSALGLAGARVDRIASSAGVNKERIYQYFGNKQQFFGEVLTRELGIDIDEVPITGTGIDAVIDYAGRVFDYQCAHPELSRLTFWEGLELGAPVAEELRRARIASKVDLILAAVPHLSREQVEELLLTVMTLADSSQALPNLNALYTGGSLHADPAGVARRGATVATVVRTWGQSTAGTPSKPSSS